MMAMDLRAAPAPETFTLDAKLLLDAVKRVKRVTPRRHSIPVLARAVSDRIGDAWPRR